MTSNQWKTLALLLLAIFTTAIIAVSDLSFAMAINSLSSEESSSLSKNSIAQNITSVTQITDVRPSDPLYSSLQSLIERYGTVGGYPDGTFRPERFGFRAEMASSLNAILDKLGEIRSAKMADAISKEDLEVAKKLLAEINAEIAVIKEFKIRG